MSEILHDLVGLFIKRSAGHRGVQMRISLTMLRQQPSRPGVVAMSQYFPKLAVSQSRLEVADKVGEGKYRKGNIHYGL